MGLSVNVRQQRYSRVPFVKSVLHHKIEDTSLHSAIRQHNLLEFRIILKESTVSIYDYNEEGLAAVHLIAMMGETQFLDELIQFEVDQQGILSNLNIVRNILTFLSKDGLTALHLAVVYQQHAFLKRLLVKYGHEIGRYIFNPIFLSNKPMITPFNLALKLQEEECLQVMQDFVVFE